jgi:hypothetical protein
MFLRNYKIILIISNKQYSVFFKKLFIWLLVIVIIHLLSLVFFTDGYFDSYYRKFTQPATSLIIGTSRANQGIMPSILDSSLKTHFTNYAFNIAVSPYGPVYNNSIYFKLNKTLKNQLFIVTVDPWSLSVKNENVNDNEELFRERNTFLENVKKVSKNPNIQYLNQREDAWGSIIIESLKSRFFKILIASQKKNTFISLVFPFNMLKPNAYSYLHKDGWLEVTLRDFSENFLEKRTKEKIVQYEKEWKNNYHYSKNREDYLSELIDTLKNFGTVIMVRMPVHRDMQAFEDNYCNDFDIRMHSLSIYHNITYLNMVSGQKYQFTDGNHLTKFSALDFTKCLADSIFEIIK